MTGENATAVAGEFALELEVWQQFVEHHWERDPIVLKSPFQHPLLTPEELFDALIAAAEAFSASRNVQYRSTHIRFSRRHTAVITDVGRFLPTRDDGSAMGYFHRLEQCLRGEPFELIVNECQEHSLPLWDRLSSFLRSLYHLVGLPARTAEVALFLRNHEKTSFGVHRDDASVFLFPLQGRKRILAWRPEVFASTNVTSTLEYEQFRDEAIILEGEPGDVLYWPSTHWHIGEADPGASITANLGLHVVARPEEELWSAMRLTGHGRVTVPMASRCLPCPPYDLQERAPRLPTTWQEWLRALQEATLDGSLAKALQLVWVNRVTGRGFTHCPSPQRPEPVHEEAVVRALTPIVWIPWSTEKIACSANGHAFAITSTPGVLPLLEHLSRGTPHSVQHLLDVCAGEELEERAFLCAVLARLVALRAVMVCPGAAAQEVA